MVVLVSELPENLRYANLCRIPPDMMDRLGIKPGDLVLLKSPQNGKKSFVRVTAKCFFDSDDCKDNSLPVIQIDPNLIEYLELGICDQAELTTEEDAPELSWLCFETTREIENHVLDELIGLIRSAKWPVYPGAFFSVNMDGNPVNLMVMRMSSEFSVISRGTAIRILSPSESNQLEIQDKITGVEIAITQIKTQQAVIKGEIKKIEAKQKIIDEETRLYEYKVGKLRDQIKKIEARLHKIPERRKELEEKIVSIKDEKSRLERRLEELTKEHSEIGCFDIDDKRRACNKLENDIKEVLEGCEEIICRIKKEL